MTRDRRPPPAKLPPPKAGPAPGSSSEAAGAEGSPARPTELAGRIRAEIEGSPGRRITFARFMERALYEPGLGYYAVAADRPTDAGDFLTAPETHPIFGWTVARRIEAMWSELGRPGSFSLIEYGAGSGTLGLSILDGFRRHGAADLLAAVRYEPIESNPHRLTQIERRFEEAGLAGILRVAGAAHLAGAGPSAGATPGIEAVPVTGVLIANEFLDALPVHRVVVRGGHLLELFVACRDDPGRAAVNGPAANGPAAGRPSAGEFVEVAAEPSTPLLAERLAADGVELAEGQVAEICLGLEPWLREAAARLGRGFALAIDYGFDAAELYGPRRLAGTMLGYRGHHVVENPLLDPGQIDITAHVDFSAVERIAASLGLRTVSSTTQSEFLVAAGLEDELRALQSSPDLTLADYTRARSGIVRMLDPRHMGRFRVLTLASG
jgi:SAM-dependent MidA family methyltransferase